MCTVCVQCVLQYVCTACVQSVCSLCAICVQYVCTVCVQCVYSVCAVAYVACSAPEATRRYCSMCALRVDGKGGLCSGMLQQNQPVEVYLEYEPTGVGLVGRTDVQAGCMVGTHLQVEE